jgi:DNA polymerase-3 subunit chi
MTEVFFYLSDEKGGNTLFALTQRLLQTAWQKRRQVYVHCEDADQCGLLDDWLWQTPASFLPHWRVDMQITAIQNAPLLLGWQEVPDDQHDVLVNLTSSVPDFFSRFTRVAEPVGSTENEREAARQRWRFYQGRGYKVQKFAI